MAYFEDRDQNGTLTTEEDTTDPDLLEVHHNACGTISIRLTTGRRAFGMQMDGIVRPDMDPEQRYRYNGKELDEATGLYDYGARYYDPAIARWGQIDPLADQYAPYSPYNYVLGNPISLIDPDGMQVDGDYYSQDGRYLGTDNIDDDKVYVQDENGETSFGEGIIAGGGKFTELSIGLSDFKYLAGVLYAEGSSTWEEAAGIYSVLENRAAIKGNTTRNEATVSNGVYGALEVDKISDVLANDAFVQNAYRGLIEGLTSDRDYSGGAYWWDGKDFNGSNRINGGYRERYLPGYKFTSNSHDLWGQGDNIVTRKNSYGTWSYKYISTAAAGNTTFSRLSYDWRKARYSSRLAPNYP